MALSAFEQAFASARKAQGAGGTFDFQGKSYSTNYAEESTASKGLKKAAAEKKLSKQNAPDNSGGDGGGTLNKIMGGIAKLGGSTSDYSGDQVKTTGDTAQDIGGQVAGMMGPQGQALAAGGDAAGEMAKDLFGGAESDAGEAAGGAVSGAAKGFAVGGPVGAAVGAVAGGVMGLMGAKEKREARKKLAEAEGMKYKAQAEAQKGEIQGKMSAAFSKTLLSGMDRKVSL